MVGKGIPPNILRGASVIISEEERDILSHQAVSCPLIPNKTCRVYYNYEWDTRCADCPLVQI